MPALQVTVRERALRSKSRREKTLRVSLPAEGSAVSALLAALALPKHSRVDFSVRNVRPLPGDAVVGRVAHCSALGRLKPPSSPAAARDADEDDPDVVVAPELGGPVEEAPYVPDINLKVAAAATGNGGCVRVVWALAISRAASAWRAAG